VKHWVGLPLAEFLLVLNSGERGRGGCSLSPAYKTFDIAAFSLVLGLFVFDFIYFPHGYLKGAPVFSIKKKMLQSGNNPRRKVKTATVTRFWIVLTGMFTSWLFAAA